MFRPTEVRAQRQIYKNGWIEVLLIGEGNSPGMIAVGSPIAFTEQQEDSYVNEPTMRLRPDTAQQMMDELWRCGLRPTEGTGSAGSLAATERHLKDMQSVAFGLLERQGVKR